MNNQIKLLSIKLLPQNVTITKEITPQTTLDDLYDQFNSTKQTTANWSCELERRKPIKISKGKTIMNQIPIDQLIIYTSTIKKPESEEDQISKLLQEVKEKDKQLQQLEEQYRKMGDIFKSTKYEKTPQLEEPEVLLEKISEDENEKSLEIYLDIQYKQKRINKLYKIPEQAKMQYLVDLAMKDFNLQGTQAKADLELFGNPYNEPEQRQLQVIHLVGNKSDLTFNISIT